MHRSALSRKNEEMLSAHAENAGAFFGGCIAAHCPEKRRSAVYENAGCNFRRVHLSPVSRKTKICRVRKCRMQFSAGASQPTVPKNEDPLCTPKMQDAISGGCIAARCPEKRNDASVCAENAGCNFRRVRASAPSRKTKTFCLTCPVCAESARALRRITLTRPGTSRRPVPANGCAIVHKYKLLRLAIVAARKALKPPTTSASPSPQPLPHQGGGALKSTSLNHRIRFGATSNEASIFSRSERLTN